MIATCRHCLCGYWRYRRDHPPSGYCSIPHAELGPHKKQGAPKPDKPDICLFNFRAHRISVHRDRSFLQDYECPECETLQGLYVESMSYWIDHPLNVGEPERPDCSI